MTALSSAWVPMALFQEIFILPNYNIREFEMAHIWKSLSLFLYHTVLSAAILFKTMNSKVSYLRVTDKFMLSDKQNK